jgi:hypothetical protein
MIDSNKRSSEIALLKKKLQSTGLEIHVANIAASYRMAGNRKRAFHWWKRAAGNRGRTVQHWWSWDTAINME